MKIGFVGAGRMGYRMIGNLLHHRHEVCVFDNDEAALRRVAERGAAAASLAEVARQEIAITMLPTPDVSLQV
ncbi:MULTISPECIES: NAD(P)-binding domain-containing protein [unclassified Caballeronia]|jgi:3-hydroxyisobutyrate dehydrogenase-like beta-hydroxyacid dehydrogenase|uniref:NAD(P)-binding domain-containing protein n=1 Tax=unclassified Caballeronia TaxID=2646786 RepID=UPI0020283DA9|nr:MULTISPECIES: NAD(P)-binding domain-containing protein [unclassified Caballeronia]